jgi:uncharacterized ion transporter superfamily protein YfcC
MNQKAGAQISTRAFVQSVIILFVLMMAAGLLTRIVPAGSYTRLEQDGRQVIDPASFHFSESPHYPIWRWFTAPLEVLWGPDGLTIIVIIVFLLIVGLSFAVLDQSGLLREVLGRIVKKFEGRKYYLLMVMALFFMLIGAFFGIFEEIVPIVPLMIGLSYFLGWDALVGLGMSILAVNMGFSAAITNPFTLGVSQQLAGLPLFSGAWYRILIFAAIYLIFTVFLVRYARRIEQQPELSYVHAEDRVERERYRHLELDTILDGHPGVRRAMLWLLVFVILIMLVVVSGPLIPAISSFSLPIVGLLFFIGGVGASLVFGTSGREVARSARDGLLGILPAVPLILMAASIKYIVSQGGILDTILYRASQSFVDANPFVAVLLIYALALLIEFFIASGSAKAFLLIPLLMPLADLVGVTRQSAVTAYIFGDGFSNLAYPTNPVLLICLGLSTVSFANWLKWTARLWVWVALVTVISLGIAVAISYGPF